VLAIIMGGTNLSADAVNGGTALHQAIAHGHIDRANALIRAGAAVEAKQRSTSSAGRRLPTMTLIWTTEAAAKKLAF
jgi:ankyrin repeat protein